MKTKQMNKAFSKIVLSDACHVRKTAKQLPDSIRPKTRQPQLWPGIGKEL